MIKRFVLFLLITSLFLKLVSGSVLAGDEVAASDETITDDGDSASGYDIANNTDFANDDYKKVILIINQVRGDECCDTGNEKALVQQIDSLKSNKLKGNFSLRYDALLNPAYVKILKDLNADDIAGINQFNNTIKYELGAFLEITPKLAQDAGVLYKGDVTDWYKAQYVYTVGYEFEDRKKIIDKYMEEFLGVFGEYPKFATAWIMDTDSVNYMNEKYGVLTHQITREQWGTDSYTMSGGPVHYPYFASKNWLFVSGGNNSGKSGGRNQNQEQNQNQTLVLRQTGSDPMFNYGDSTNSFTTQPNDYAIGNRGFDYFRNLKNELINQRQNNYGFLLLGLENSMAQQFQDEYARQIDSIKDDGEITTMTVSEFNLFAKNNIQAVVGLEGNDLVNNSYVKSFWVNTKNYRARLILKDNKLSISDLRITNENLEDPYNNYVAQDLAFWVTPFIFNASQQYSMSEPINLSFKESFLHSLRKKYLPEMQKVNFEAKSSRNDFSTFFDGLNLTENVKEIQGFSRTTSGDLVLSWLDKDDKTNKITFTEDQMSTNFLVSSKDLMLDQSDFLKVNKSWKGFEIVFKDDNIKDNTKETSLSMDVACSSVDCKIAVSPLDDNVFSKLREDYYPYFFPEITDRIIDNLKSVFYAHNQYAVVGKNPVRFVFIPKDDKGFATNYESQPEIIVTPEPDEIDLHEKQANGTTFLDIYSNKTGKYEVQFKVDDLIDKKETVYFAPDCKNNIGYCALHPVESIRYLSSMFYTKLRNF